MIDKYNGYQTISIEFARKARKEFQPIDIIYKLTKNPERKPLFYFRDISRAYCNSHSVGEDKVKHGFAYECCYCKTFLQDQRDIKVT